MSTSYHSMAPVASRHLAQHHSQPQGVGRHIKGNIKRLGEFLAVGMLFLGFQAIEQFKEGMFTTGITSSVQQIIPASAASGAHVVKQPESLYLLDKASLHIPQIERFEDKVRDVSGMLGVAPEWLMAVMYSESKFDPGVRNFKGSGATGLIQFMAGTAGEMNISLERLGRMDAVQQLEYVYLYLQTVRDRYGDYSSLTDLYLAILYPKARGEEYCYTLYARPSKQYNQNSGLDENKDGRVSVSDIEKRMKRLYPTAYMAEPAYM